MQVRLHANATTTPKVRAHIQASASSVADLANELGVSETTIRRWRRRSDTTDRSHAPKRRTTKLTLDQEALIRELRLTVGLSLDDIVEVMRRCVEPTLSRSAIHRCLKRHGINARPPVPKPAVGHFDPAPVGFIHIDLKHLAQLVGQKSYVFVAIDRATRFVHVEIASRRDSETIAACLERFLEAFPHRVHTILTDNGSEFTDRFAKGQRDGKPSGRHPFDAICQKARIEHRLTRPFHPQTNGMAERFNRRLAEALREAPPASRNGGKNRFNTHDQRNVFIKTFVENYNRTRLRCLDYRAPLETLNNLPEHNTKAGWSAGAYSPVRQR